jgi:hypothetical protein
MFFWTISSWSILYWFTICLINFWPIFISQSPFMTNKIIFYTCKSLFTTNFDNFRTSKVNANMCYSWEIINVLKKVNRDNDKMNDCWLFVLKTNKAYKFTALLKKNKPVYCNSINFIKKGHFRGKHNFFLHSYPIHSHFKVYTFSSMKKMLEMYLYICGSLNCGNLYLLVDWMKVIFRLWSQAVSRCIGYLCKWDKLWLLLTPFAICHNQ